jgi:hypothetical protein
MLTIILYVFVFSLIPIMLYFAYREKKQFLDHPLESRLIACSNGIERVL